jgi:ubiquitin-protein ligase
MQCCCGIDMHLQADTPWAGGFFKANVDIPAEYPFRAPTKVPTRTAVIGFSSILLTH